MNDRKNNRPDSRGFTLVELVVVVLILGILAAVAAPRYLEKSEVATENAFRRSLKVARDAIAAYALQNDGSFPAQDLQEATFRKELRSYLRRFPKNPYGDLVNATRVKIAGDGSPLAGKVGGDGGWLYDAKSGQFIANSLAVSSEGVKYFQY